MSVWKPIERAISKIEEWLAIIAFVAMTLVVIAIVLCRYVFSIRFMAGEELARYLMIWCAYAGAAYGFRKKSHVGVVVFAEMMPKSVQKYVVHIRHICSAVVMIGLTIFAFMVFRQYLATNQLTTVMKLPTAWVYVIVPICIALGAIHTIVDVIEGFASQNDELAKGDAE